MTALCHNKGIIRKVTEAINKHNLSSLDRFFSSDFYNKTYQFQSLDDFKKYYTRLFKGFPDWHEYIEDFIAEGDKVWVSITYTGTHKGEYRGLAPNGKKHTVVGVVSYRIVNRKIVEAWVVEDTLDSLKQLGLIEYTKKGKQILPKDV